MRAFVDTNLWAYRLDRRDPDEAIRIASWLRTLAADHQIVVSTHKLLELRSVLTCKFQPLFIAIIYLDLVIALVVWFIKLAGRCVHAQEQSAQAMQRIAQSVAQIAQSGPMASRNGP